MRPSTPWRGLLILPILSSLAPGAHGRTWRVGTGGKVDTATIQAAIDSASTGDSILVNSGVYDENLFVPPDRWLAILGVVGARSTVIDGGFQGAVMTIMRGALIQGFTIRNGRYLYGAGIRFEGHDDLSIRDNIIEGNHAGFVSDEGPGGGVYITAFSPGINLIEGNLIRNNSARENGGGIYTLSDATIQRNTISANACGLNGAGIYRSGGSVTENVLVGNHAGSSGGGLLVAGYAEVRNNTIYENRVDALFSVGAGIHVDFFALIRQNLVVANSGPTGRQGAGIYLCNASALLECNDVWNNQINSVVCGSSGGGDFSADPQFCATDPQQSMSFALQNDSPCLPGNHPQGANCGLIGAQSTRCGTMDVQRSTWTRWKSLFR